MTAVQFKSNGSLLPSASASTTANAIHTLVHASRNEIRATIVTLPIGGVTAFATRNPVDSGGKTQITVERIA
jgi:hypothetical protein